MHREPDARDSRILFDFDGDHVCSLADLIRDNAETGCPPTLDDVEALHALEPGQSCLIGFVRLTRLADPNA